MPPPAVSALPAQRLVPSGRSLAVGFGLLAAAALLYVGALRTPVFAINEVTVESLRPAESRLVERALRGLAGKSLLEIDETELRRRLAPLPHVHLLSYDRAFPNELRVRVSVERPAAVLRRGSERWLVSTEGRVLRPLERRLRRPLPVVWADASVEPEVGSLLDAPEAARAVSLLAAIRRADSVLARRVWYVETSGEQLTAVLRNRFELRLGSRAELPLKLAVARRVLAALERDAEARYADVSLPERAVVGVTLNSEVER
ncbi:MAG: cell division protein FtsQ/DivIB [Actinomycetota bacterium]|nr:cell division protein FtsQ/DivIB [Actinomycetota bacterium]